MATVTIAVGDGGDPASATFWLNDPGDKSFHLSLRGLLGGIITVLASWVSFIQMPCSQ